ncbi:hypothetical protein HDU88_001588 [Geranomyces variabilis]|nr:hypothetical protein HDU88_001588 [Geranomyces variabilis]
MAHMAKTTTTPTRYLIIRLATLSDLDACAAVSSLAYRDTVFYRWLCPYSSAFPEDFTGMWKRRHARVLADKHWFTVVCEELCPQDNTQKIVGVSEWQRKGKGKERVWETNGDVEAKDAAMATLLATTTAIVNRAFSYERNDPLNAWGARQPSTPEVEHPHWYLNLLAVDPAMQRKGIGEMLSRWGMDRAERDGLYVTLYATEDGGRLYRRLGFVVTGKLVRDVEGTTDGELDADEMRWGAIHVPCSDPVTLMS